jgi:hypothetical protein
MEDKRLDRLFEYTKFHIGIYLSAAGGLVTLIGLSAKPPEATFINLLVGSRAALGVSLVLMLFAGMAGGIIASATTKYKDYEDLWLKPQGPFSTCTNILGRTWAAIEHGAFWLSVIFFSYSIFSADAVQKWFFP